MAGRGNGEGSISRRKDGRWVARYFVGNKRRSIYAHTRSEAAARLAQAIAERDGGVDFDAERITFGEYVDRWLEGAIKNSVKPRTLETYSTYMSRHAKPALGRLALRKISPGHLEALYAERLASGLSGTTVGQLHSVLAQALSRAVKWRLIPYNPADAVSRPRASTLRRRPLTATDARRLLGAAREQGPAHEALYALALCAGLRIGEILALRWQDVDLSEGRSTILVERTANYQGGLENVRYGTPKGGKSRRVPLSGALAVLTRHRARQREELLASGFHNTPDLLFVGPRLPPGPLTPRTASRRMDQLLEYLGIPRITFHDLRHTAATLMVENGEHPRVVQEILGHASITTTMDTYSHVSVATQVGAVGRLDSMLF